MFWKLRESPIIIPVELHDKLARTSKPIEEIDSEVVCVRSVSLDSDNILEAAEPMPETASDKQVADRPDMSDAIGYEAHWQWYR